MAEQVVGSRELSVGILWSGCSLYIAMWYHHLRISISSCSTCTVPFFRPNSVTALLFTQISCESTANELECMSNSLYGTVFKCSV